MLSRAEQKFIQEQLQYFSCTDREVSIYLEALQMGPVSVQALAKQIGQNRITVHSATEQLVKKGLLYESRSGKRRLLVAEEPDSLFRLLSKKENELEYARANLGYAVGLLRRVHSPVSSRPSVQFHEGVEGFRRMLDMTLSAKGEFLALINVELFSEHLSAEYLENYFERRSEGGIHSRLIWPEENSFAQLVLKDAAKHKIQVRYLPTGEKWRSGFISWNNCISLVSFSAGQITCTIVENDDIVSFYRDIIFESLWRSAVRTLA